MNTKRDQVLPRYKGGFLRTAILGVLLAFITTPVLSRASTEQQQLVDKAKVTIEAFAADPGQKAAVNEWVNEAKGLFIIPQLLRGAFIFGGAGGSGILLVRDDKSGEWSEPAFYNVGALSFGLQAGADTSELVVVVRTQKGLKEFYRSDFKIGAGMGTSMGPAGGSASVEGVTADLLSFGRTKGAFAGAALNGAIIAVSDDSNQLYYGKPVKPEDILVKKMVSNPASAELRTAVVEFMK